MTRLTDRERRRQEKLGEILKAARVAAGFDSIRAAARAAGVTHPHVSQVEKGGRSASVYVIARLARAYGTSLLTILRRAGYR